MRTSEERVQELHARMDKRAEMKDRRSFMVKTALVFAACVAIMIGMAIMIARLPIKTPGYFRRTRSAGLCGHRSPCVLPRRAGNDTMLPYEETYGGKAGR